VCAKCHPPALRVLIAQALDLHPSCSSSPKSQRKTGGLK